jgi:hypothetical protein
MTTIPRAVARSSQVHSATGVGPVGHHYWAHHLSVRLKSHSRECSGTIDGWSAGRETDLSEQAQRDHSLDIGNSGQQIFWEERLGQDIE